MKSSTIYTMPDSYYKPVDGKALEYIGRVGSVDVKFNFNESCGWVLNIPHQVPGLPECYELGDVDFGEAFVRAKRLGSVIRAYKEVKKELDDSLQELLEEYKPHLAIFPQEKISLDVPTNGKSKEGKL